MINDLSLQLALAKELPELIYTGFGPGVPFVWIKEGCSSELWEDVTPREWPWIVSECEKKLRNNQFHFVHYSRELWDTIYPEVKYTGSLGYLGFDYVTAPWQTRAIVYFKTIGKEIK